MQWKMLEVPADPERARLAIRLNSLGSLYFFVKITLQRDKLSPVLHRYIAQSLEQDRPRYLLELPRDHYKTTIVTEGRTMWRSLPFSEIDEISMRALGYEDEWIRWMKRAHNPARRTLTVSEVLMNAIKIGSRFDWHFQENQIFKRVFPEIIPDTKCIWNNETKQQKCASRGPQGEGTFDFIGVGGALQSRHYTDINEDDPVGKDALKSELVMNDTIDYHRLLIGAFEEYSVGNWTYVSNRWSPHDPNGWIRENQREFVVESHSALGGCCDMHPDGVPIFPEMFSVADLEEIRRVQGPYLFSHQFLNLPIAPEECIFNKDWLRFYEPTPAPNKMGRNWLHHEVYNGKVLTDINPNLLIRTMVVDPNHAGADGRARHAIVVTGLDPESDRIYLLDVWAASMSYDDLCSNIYRMADLWNLREFWLETIAAQKYLKYHLEYRNKIEKRYLTVRELKSEHGKNAKRTRIEALEPLFRDGRFWSRHDQSSFLDEFYAYPGGRTVDILDCLGYATQTWNTIYSKGIMKLLNERRDQRMQRRSVTGY